VSSRVLEQLTSDEFFFSAAGLSTPSALRRFLGRRPEVAAIGEALLQGAITEDSLRRFVSRLTVDFRRGERFVHELALAALAVAVEKRPTDFAEEFLHDLARLRIAEVSMAMRVARECLERRVSVADNKSKTFTVMAGNGPVTLSVSGAARGGAAGAGPPTPGYFVCGAA
jgi:hypothetical protein